MSILNGQPIVKKVLPVFIMGGFGVPILFTIVWITAAAFDGTWIFGWNALSDMGASKSQASQIIFNYGCVLTGVCGCIFGYGVMKYETKWLAVTGLITMVGCIFLMGVGAIPETFGTPHLVCAGLFGGFSVVAMATSAYGDWRHGRKIYTGISLLMLVICGVIFAFEQSQFGIWEAICIICILVWVGSQAIKYYQLIGLVEIEDQIAFVFEQANEIPSAKKKLD